MTTALMETRSLLEKAKDKLLEVAPKYLNVERVTRLILAAQSRNPKLAACTPQSVLQFCMKCAETGLEPIGAGGAWPVPYENRKNNTVEMQFIPDYRGLINAAKRADCIKDSWAEVVREKDHFAYSLGLHMTLEHVPARGDRGALEAAYCVMVMPDDTRRFVVMDRMDINGIRARSRAANNGPWQTDEGEMWKKTVVRRAMKPFAGASSELNAAIEADNAASGVELDKGEVEMPKRKMKQAEEAPPDDGSDIGPARGDNPAPPDSQAGAHVATRTELLAAIAAAPKGPLSRALKRRDLTADQVPECSDAILAEIVAEVRQ